MHKILIIESNIETSRLLSEFFVSVGYDVVTFTESKNLYIHMEILIPDLILISCALKRDSGFDVCKLLRKIQNIKEIPILMYSERDDANAVTRALASGADDYVPLSLNIRVLDSKVKSLIRINNLRNELQNRYKELKEKNELLETQLKMGKMVQRSLIRDLSIRQNNTKIVSKYMPAIEIGGDFFDIISIDKDLVSVIIGDVSGHGISAALLTAMLNLMTKSLVPKYTNPAQVLYHMNNELCKLFENSELPLFVCVFYVLIDTKKKMIYYANAGQPQPFYVDSATGAVRELECSGMPIGMMENTTYEYRNHKFNSGDLLLIYTDGLADNGYKNNPEEFYTHMSGMLSDMCGQATTDIIVNSLESRFCKISGSELDKYRLDDASMILCEL